MVPPISEIEKIAFSCEIDSVLVSMKVATIIRVVFAVAFARKSPSVNEAFILTRIETISRENAIYFSLSENYWLNFRYEIFRHSAIFLRT